MTIEEALGFVDELGAVRYFPRGDAAVRAALAGRLMAWCSGVPGSTPKQQGRWLIDKILDTWTEWQGVAAMRELFGSRFPIPK